MMSMTTGQLINFQLELRETYSYLKVEVVNSIQQYIPQPLLEQQRFWILGAAQQHHPVS